LYTLHKSENAFQLFRILNHRFPDVFAVCQF